MWQHRQEERELKRAELDMQKQRRNIQRAMKDYEHSACGSVYNSFIPV